ncbi:hypothetical protein MVES1_003297 [Malassezia vespertilionis]|uniref:Uncharacterized protein n=1 Tax=Malassezia vespertilionis TaxID=2020962 RepID=A0A2N1J6U8_9BASI|nr:uncharacterized protein MVES1_003297 [Malassezia vespertilionis]PKI82277.1 hypothetical protein MVES_003796 [Malassezia vespertilionis]WFD07928.1 hypothetical protein MVES1_003297 [Malassezia vespertilionis]
MAFAQPGTHSHGLCGKSLDTARLKQRLGSLLFDIQSGSDQFESLWDRWYAPEDAQDSLPFGVLDKPQTAAPPVTPPTNICDYIDSNFSQSVQMKMNPPQASQDVEIDAILEESAQKFDAMAVGSRNIPARF